MSKSDDSPQGTILVLEDLASVAKKIKRAVTDTDNEVRYDPDGQAGRVEPAVDPRRVHRSRARPTLAEGYTQYGAAQDRHRRRRGRVAPARSRPATPSWPPIRPAPRRCSSKGADKARAVAGPTLARAKEALGLLPSG